MSFLNLPLFRKFLGAPTAPSSRQANSPAPGSNGGSSPMLSPPSGHSGFPPTFGPPLAAGETEDDLIFDPATRHYGRAFRRGDPRLPPEQTARWQAARRRATHHLLTIATAKSRGNHLVLRGSLALKSWLGENAREPGDIDWVVRPPEMQMNGPEAARLIADILQDVAAEPRSGEVEIDARAVAQNEIWTYDRAPGHRLAFAWRCGDLPPAVVQMDFVFQQRLFTAPSLAVVKCEGLPAVLVSTASEEESLAWKLLWLYTDMEMQGKDLYDAVLLAERVSLSGSLLKGVLLDADPEAMIHKKQLATFPFPPHGEEENLNWGNFLKECPWVTGTASEWVSRLRTAIAPAVAELNEARDLRHLPKTSQNSLDCLARLSRRRHPVGLSREQNVLSKR